VSSVVEDSYLAFDSSTLNTEDLVTPQISSTFLFATLGPKSNAKNSTSPGGSWS